MKNLIYLTLSLLLFTQCKNEDTVPEPENKEQDVEVVEEKEVILEVPTDEIIQYGFKISRVDSVTFKKNQVKFKVPVVKINKITDVPTIIEKTKNHAKIGYQVIGENKEKYYYLEKIILKTGEVIYCNTYSECGIYAYYPDHNIIVSECGHQSDDCYNILTGKSTMQVGNPEYILESPNKKFRLNGYFPGQECSNYFIQKNINGEYLKVLEINEVYPYKNVPESMCTMKDLFWSDDFTLNFTLMNYQGDDGGVKEFYQLKIKEIK